MLIEKRKPLEPTRRLHLKLNNNYYTLDSFSLKTGGVQVILNDNGMENDVTLGSKKLLNAHFKNKDDWMNFLKTVEQLFRKHKNNRYILLDLNKNYQHDKLWINPNYIFDEKNTKNNKKQNYVNYNQVSILGLIEEDGQGQSILSRMGVIEPFSSFKSAGTELKCKIRFNSGEFHFTLNRKTNQFSTWKKNFGGAGAQQFLQKVIGLSSSESFNLLKTIGQKTDLSSLVIECDYFEFKNASPLPISSSKGEDMDSVISYFDRVRNISPAITKELINKGAVKFASMIRTSKNVFDDVIKDKKGSNEKVNMNFPKASINAKQIYFPLFDKKGKEQSIQFLASDEKISKAKMNQGSTYGIYSGFKNKGSKNYILSEAAFDNFALYEACKNKINTNNYNFMSCQSVGGIETWIESNFGYSFVEDKKTNEIKIQKTSKRKEIVDLSDKYIEKLKNEFLGDEPRKFVMVYNPTDKNTIEKMKIIESSFKKIDNRFNFEWIESKNRYIKFFDYKPLDVVLDSTSIDSWIERNSFSFKNRSLQKEKTSTITRDITDKDIQSFANKNIESIISATDNDTAGHVAREKIKLFCKTFNIKFADWSPTQPDIKDHNDCLKLSKGIPVFIDDENNEGKKLKIEPSKFDQSKLFDYIDESKIKLITQAKPKKKITNQAH